MAEQEWAASGRALVVLESTDCEAVPRRLVRRQAAFLAHLIAASRQVPQARERRRAEPADAIAAYRSSLGRLGPI